MTMKNTILTLEQESSLISQGYCSLPQIKNKNISEIEIKNLIINKDNKIYTSGTDFHKRYIKNNNIYSHLKKDLLEVAKKYYNKNSSFDDTYEITRITKGSQKSESYLGHFDSHLFTLVTPIAVPQTNSKESGQLIIFPMLRKEPQNEFSNILGKIYYKKYLSKSRFTTLMKDKKYMEFDFKDMNPVLFLGRVSLHGNRGFKEEAESHRITLLTHFFDPSPRYGIGNILRFFRSR